MAAPALPPAVQSALRAGAVIPAHPLALTSNRKLDERRQRALSRYYVDAGAEGLAVGVHTTQFQIRDPSIGLFEPVLTLAAEEMSRVEGGGRGPLIRIAGLIGKTSQAIQEAELARSLGYHAGLLSLAAWKEDDNDSVLEHCRLVADEIPIFGFYLQPAVGGRILDYSFWRRFAEIENVVAIKIAPFNRYQTLDAVRAVAESGRDDIALYTGNDDNIVLDLLTPFAFQTARGPAERRIVGGLLGHWAVWTRKAVELLRECHEVVAEEASISRSLLRRSIEVTDSNAAFFDAANGFAGCIAGIHEVLRRQGLLENILCLDPNERLSPGQSEEIDRVYSAYPNLNDDAFVTGNRDKWLGG
jgi:dihydrodipicolinate synthase/N-acetylneuraminate lyase